VHLSAPAVAERVRRLEQSEVAAGSMDAFEALIDRLDPYGRPSSTTVLSSPLPWRLVTAGSAGDFDTIEQD
jgi:hypothetical protein